MICVVLLPIQHYSSWTHLCSVSCTGPFPYRRYKQHAYKCSPRHHVNDIHSLELKKKSKLVIGIQVINYETIACAILRLILDNSARVKWLRCCRITASHTAFFSVYHGGWIPLLSFPFYIVYILFYNLHCLCNFIKVGLNDNLKR